MSRKTFFDFVCSTSALLFLSIPLALQADRIDRYVDKASTNSVPPYDSWANAATNIQTAIDAADAGQGDEVIVRAGVYDEGGRKSSESRWLTNRVVISKAIVVRSENNDPTNTIIKGQWQAGGTNGPAAIRGVYMVGGASLIGFTVTNGATVVINDVIGPISSAIGVCALGGGIFAADNSVISNCIITGNAAFGDSYGGRGGGGAFQGTYYDCKFIGNQAGPLRSVGGGVDKGTLYRCLLVGNRAARGGGAFRGTLYDCIVSNNVADARLGDDIYAIGGGIAGWDSDSPSSYVRAYNCLIVNNRGDRGGGVGYRSILHDSKIIGNSTPVTPGQSGFGGGAYIATLMNCNIVSNKSSNGAGTYNSTVSNSFIGFNEGWGVARNPRTVNSLIYGNSNIGIQEAASFTIESCTIIGNGSYGLYISSAGVCRNSIVYGNYGSGLNNWVEVGGGAITFENSCTTPAKAGWDASNIEADPRFVDPGSGYGLTHVKGDYRLKGSSPCLNRGQVLEWMSDATDLAGNPRLDKLTGLPDMGCYELVYSGSAILVR